MFRQNHPKRLKKPCNTDAGPALCGAVTFLSEGREEDLGPLYNLAWSIYWSRDSLT